MRRSIIAVVLAFAMVTVVLNLAHPARSEIIVSGHNWGGLRYDFASAVEVDSAGNIYIAGLHSEETDWLARGFVAKFAADGSLAWDLALQHESMSTTVLDMAIGSDGDIFLLLGGPSKILAKVSSTGTVMFAEEILGIAQPVRIAYNPANGGAIVIGDKRNYGEGVVASFSSTGSEIWSRTYEGLEWASPWGVTADASGNVFAVMDRSYPDDVGVVEFSPQGDLLRQVVLSTESIMEWSWDIIIGPGGDVYVVGFDFGDGNWTSGNGSVSHAYAAAGEYLVQLTVVDDGGGTDTASAMLYVTENLPPVASLKTYPDLPNPYDTVYFDGSGSYDPDGWIQNYLWDFGDGYSMSTYYNYCYHSYYQGGIYLATLTVTDEHGATNSTSVWVHVNMPPVAVIVPSADVGKVGSVVIFDGSMSYDPEGSEIVEYNWYFSDGPDNGTSGPVVAHTFFAAGSWTVGLSVREANGTWGYTSISFPVVTPLPPVAIAAYSPPNPLVGEEVAFDGGNSVDPDGSIVTYIWQFGDGAVATGELASHSYVAPGVYEVKLTVIDEDKLIDDDLVKVTVASIPTAAFEYYPSAPTAGQEVMFYAVGSYDPAGISMYVWSFGDGMYAQGWQVSHTFAQAGDFTVSLTVTNTFGVQATASKTLSVVEAQTMGLTDASTSMDLSWDESAQSSIEFVAIVLGVLSFAIGLIVGDVLALFGRTRRHR